MSPDGPTFGIARWVFLRMLGAIYLLAFGSLLVQIPGLIGEDGILPAGDFLESQRERFGTRAYHLFPSLFWLGSGDGAMQFGAWSGVILSAFLMVGFVPPICLLLLWGLYLSLQTVGQTFLSFQWDVLLLETGFLALFIAPFQWGPRMRALRPVRWIVLVPLWWLLIRLMFGSGIVKLYAGKTWTDLTALRFHYWTQPIPTPIGWWAGQLPDWFQSLSTLAMFGIEVGLPALLFLALIVQVARFPFSCRTLPPFRWIRTVAFSGTVLLMLLILLTGNYGIFNLLAIALSVLLLDDRQWVRVIPRRFRDRILRPGSDEPRQSRIRAAALVLAGVVMVALGSLRFSYQIRQKPLSDSRGVTREIFSTILPFNSVNEYRLFIDMTTERPEVLVEGSEDGKDWRPYRFRWKPGDPARRPSWVAPHMPRLDWQMWFAALEHRRPLNHRSQYDWFLSFLVRLLQGSDPVLGLIEENPFPDRPPRWIRARVAAYEFSDSKARADTGAWWRHGEPGPFFPAFSLDQVR